LRPLLPTMNTADLVAPSGLHQGSPP
jgi:hypothetical protein